MRHPKRTLVIAALIIACLGVLGLNVEDRLSPTSLDVGGTQSSKADAMQQRYFGDSAPFSILLRGPAAELDRQGPALIRALRRDPKVTTISPWDKGSNLGNLRTSPNKALILVDFHVGLTSAVNDTVPYLNDLLEKQIKPPVRANQTSYASISRAIQDQSISSAEQDELIALPFLLLVLLLVFRSPVAAMIPLAFGVITVISSRGILTLASSLYSVDAFALTVSSMMGLALGVDYALLMVSRFREELAAGADPATAARTTRSTAGRTTLFAGSTLFLSMIVSIFIVPGSLLISLATTVIFVVVISVTTAAVVAPPLLAMLGPNVNRLRIGRPPGEDSFLMSAVGAALARPKLAAAVIGAVVLVLAGPAVALKTGPPSQEQLPTDDSARRDATVVNRAIGAGFSAPFSVIAATDNGTITDATHLAELTSWQHKVAALPGVRAVIGPDQVARRVKPIQKSGEDLLAERGSSGRAIAGVRRLGVSLGRAAGGVAQLRVGLAKATFGAVLLGGGAGRAEQGASTLADGLDQASSGSSQAVSALGQFATGSRKLAAGQQQTVLPTLLFKNNAGDLRLNLVSNVNPSAKRLKRDLHDEVNNQLPPLQSAAKVADDQLQIAWQQLQSMTVGQTDPNYPAALDAVRQATAAVSGTDPSTNQPYSPGYTGLPDELSAMQTRLQADADEADNVTAWLVHTAEPTLTKMRDQMARLHAGEIELTTGSKKLASGAQRLSNASVPLNNGLTSLSGGAERLTGGVSQLQDGNLELARRLSDGFRQSQPLQSAMRRMRVGVLASNRSIHRNLNQIRTQSPGIFNSGYFVLSTLDGAPPPSREQANSTIDLQHGGQAANTFVIPKYTFNTPGSNRLYRQLKGLAGTLSSDTGLRTGVAGGPALVNDYDHVTRARIPWVVAAITVATFLMLVFVLRALLLAALAVALNLLTVGVAFGVLTLLFNVPQGYPLGGHTYIDAVSATMIFGVVFGLSIDYAVFLLMRMREAHEGGADHAGSISFGLEKTARVITGAALIMMAVFIAFGSAQIATVSQLGIGLTVAVILDATVVRIVLLPALMLMFGERVWWLPRWLDRIMPEIDIHGAEATEPQAG